MPAESPPTRILALDVLRGFTMFWIVGSGGLSRALRAFGDVQPAAFLATQLEHAAWQGFRFEDFIFPTFVFIAGASLVFSLTRIVAAEGRAAAARRILIRTLLLFALGILMNGGLAKGLDEVRWLGVLQRIALAYCGAGLLFIFVPPRGLAAACIALLAGYWALLTFVPVPGIGAGDFGEARNLSDYLDRIWLPGRKYGGDHDPEGLLSTLPAIATCLLGVFAGLLLRSEKTPAHKARTLLLAGLALLALGAALDPFFPIIKKIWTSSFVLWAGGWSAVLLAASYYIIDIRGAQRWTLPFLWIGANPLLLYLLGHLLGYEKIAARLTGGDLQRTLNTALHPGLGDLLTTAVAIALSLLVARFFYTRKIFIRV